MRFFTFLSKKTSRFLLLLLMMFSWGVAWGQTVDYNHTITSKVWDANGDATLSDVVWTLDNNGNYYGYDSSIFDAKNQSAVSCISLDTAAD